MLIDGLTPQEVLKLQKKHLDALQKVPPGKPLLIKCIEGSTPEGQDPDLYRWMDFKNIWSKVQENGHPIYTRGILKNEIVFDPDVNDWATMKEQVDKLISFMELQGIPYELAYSGGKGCHVHIFFGTIELDTNDLQEGKHYDIDLFKCVRENLAKELLKQSGADPDKMGLDWGKIRFSVINGRKGSQIREYGTTRANGKFKTLVDNVPVTNPDNLPLRLPGEPKLWNISGTIFHQAVRDALKAEVDKARVRNEYNLDGITLSDTKIEQYPCYQKIKALHLQNNRYYAVSGIGLLSKETGSTREETRQILTEVLSTFEGLSDGDKALRLENSLKLYDSDKHFSCRALKERVGGHVCDFTRCPLKDKIQSVKQESMDWKTPLKQAVSETKDTDPETKIKAAKDILFNHLAIMSPMARQATFLECVCKDLGVSNRAATNIYKEFERNIRTAGGQEWFNEKGRFVPPILSEHIRKHNHFVTLIDTKEIWVYEEETGCYRPYGDVVIKKFTQDALGEFSKKKDIDEVVNHVGIETFEKRDVFDSDPDLINLKNGYFNIKTMEFGEHTPTKKFTYSLPFGYNPDAECVKFDEFLDKCGVNKTLIYEIFAYCLIDGYPIQAIFIFIGDGGNGKGTTERVLIRYLGSENITAHSMQAFEKNRYALADLFGKLANICGDTPPKVVNDTSPIKMISGGDIIQAPVIYKGNIRFVNRAKPIFLLNHLPEFEDNTDSWDRRPVYVEFNNRVDGLDPDFNEADMWTDEELSGIFNKCIEVLPDLLKRGSFTGMKTIQENREYRHRRGNPIGAFIEECTAYDDAGKCRTTYTYAAYVKWCTENNETCLTENIFGRKLLEKYPEYTKIRPTILDVDKMYRRVYHYSGFVLKEGYDKLDIIEVTEEYEKAKKYDQKKGDDNQIPDFKNLESPVQDKGTVPRFGPGSVQDKKSDFSDTEDGFDDFGPGCTPKLSPKKNSNENEVKNGVKKSGDKIEQATWTKDQKTPTDNESILDRTWAESGQNLDTESITLGNTIKECITLFEKFHGDIYGKKVIQAKFEIPKYDLAKGIDYQLIHDAIDQISKGRCLGCGSDDAPNETKGEGRRCNKCHKVYSNPPTLVVPEEFNLEPVEATP